jgi:outer membrane protein assembly factor BamB
MQRTLPLALVSWLVCSSGWPADWPTYRADPARSGSTAETLPSALRPRWTFRPPAPPQPAWPRSDRVAQDRAFQAVAAGGSVFFGSSADGKLYALDAATGSVRWTFTTEGPVRFAPTVWRGRVFAVSDDGHLYALSADDGRLLWSRRGGPTNARRLGNERMISKWPARGAPAVVDDTVYFAAGIWPSDGIFLHALDAATGEVRWTNGDSGGISMPQPHGNANAESGISAQGYLVATDFPRAVGRGAAPGGARDGGAAGDVPGDGEASVRRLLVPTGRAVPAAFDRDSGRFEYFHLQKFGRKGGSATMAVAGMFLNGGVLFDAAAGQARLTIGPGPVALTPGGLVRSGRGDVQGFAWIEADTVDRLGNRVAGPGLEPLWKVADVDGRGEVIVAGDRVVAGGAGRVTIIDDGRRVTWSAEVEGLALGLAVSDGRLLVSTDTGAIQCFDSRPVGSPVVVELQQFASPYPPDRMIAAAADEIVRVSQTLRGFCLDLGCGDGHLAFELARRTELQIVAVESDRRRYEVTRARLDAAGLLGSRVTVLHAESLDDTGLPDFFANLVVSGRGVKAGGDVPAEREAARLLRPYGGVLVAGPPGAMRVTRRGPLQGAGEWTHQYSDAANTLCSSDDLVRGRLGMLWFRDVDVEMPQRHGRGPSPLFYDGRLYAEGIDELVCLDAYNGRLLWKHALSGVLKAYDGDELMGTAGTHSNYCVAEQGVFVRHRGYCLRIDRVTGELLARFDAPPQTDGGASTWGFIACVDGVLFGTLADPDHVVTYRYVDRGGDMKSQLTESKTLFALDTNAGGLLWRYDARHSIRHNAISVGRGRVYLIDRPQATFDRRRDGKPGDDGHAPGTLLALDAAEGRELWRCDERIDGTMLALSGEHRTLVMSHQPTRFALASETGGRLSAYDAETGDRRWEREASYSSRPLINDRTIYAQGGAWDLFDGEPRPFSFARSYGCGVLAGSRHTMVYRSATLGYFDLVRRDRTENFGGTRPGCWINAIPAGGLVLVPDASAGCSCSYLNQAWFALQPEGER